MFEDPDRQLPWWFPRNLVFQRDDEFQWIKQGDVGWFGMFSEVTTERDWLQSLVAATDDLKMLDRIVYIDFHV